MNMVGQQEIRTQRRVIEHFRDVLGYSYLGNWEHRLDNSNIEGERLSDWLRCQGHKRPDHRKGAVQTRQSVRDQWQQDTI